MATAEMSPQRKGAYFKWRQAEQEAQKGHLDKAVELAHLGLEEDPEYMDLRTWLAKLLVKAEQPRKAARELEEIIHINRNHQEAWELLRKIEPATADRLDRLHNIAPDPFVMKRTQPLTEAVGDLSDLGEDDGLVGAGSTDTAGGDPFYSGAGQSDLFTDMGAEDEPEPEPEPVAEPPRAAAPAAAPPPAPTMAPDRGGHAWEYEQDRVFLAKWEAEPAVAKASVRVQDLWGARDVWDGVLSLCAHADKHLHPQIYEAAGTAAERLGVEVPELMVFPERCMHPVLVKDRHPLIAVPTGLLRGMSEPEMVFQIGREIGHIHTGYLAQMQVVKIVTNRKARLMGDLASTLDEFLRDNLKYWNEGLSREEIERLKKLGHAWQQRCELTADRAGLVCCQSVDTACAALAKTTAKSIEEASILTVDRFLQQFEGIEVGELARIPAEESPSRNARYAAYRIHMLRWWAGTPEFQAAMSRP